MKTLQGLLFYTETEMYKGMFFFSTFIKTATPHSVSYLCTGNKLLCLSLQYIHLNTTRKATRNYSDVVLTNNNKKISDTYFQIKIISYANLTLLIKLLKVNITYSHLIRYSSQLYGKL